MTLLQTLMQLEAQFWEASSAGDGDKIHSFLTEDARLVGAFGVLDRETTANMTQGQSVFEFWRFEGEPQLVALTPEAAVVVYQAAAQRTGQEPFTVLMSSTYVHRDGEWRLAFHHQTQV